MRYQLIEIDGHWVIACDGIEVARHAEQRLALDEVADRLRGSRGDERATLAVHFAKRPAA